MSAEAVAATRGERIVAALGSPRAILAAWALAAAAFAYRRVPYDDEWFQITLARDTSWGAFWWSLRHDVHPPWIALLDWATVRALGVWAMPLTRVAASLVALGLLERVLTRQLRVSGRIVALAAFHPIVFMYGGAARWYPFALLGDAARAWALFGPAAGSRRSRVVFALGALVGAASGYAEFALVAVDLAWLVATSRGRGNVRATWGTAMVAMGLAGATIAASPLLPAHRAIFGGARGWEWHSAATWLGLGLVGEAWLPWPATPLALVALPAVAWGVWRLLRAPSSRTFGAWLVTVALAWLALTGAGVWHPRYSLLLWFSLTAAAGAMLAGGRAARVAAGATYAYLAVALAMTIDQRWFVKGDLDRMPATACRELLPQPPADLVVAPYPRTKADLERVCATARPIVTAGWIRHVPFGSGEEVAPIRAALPVRGIVDLVTVPVVRSSLVTTNEDARALLAARCTLLEARRAVPAPHLALKRWLIGPEVVPLRFQIERWRCGEEAAR